MLLRRLNSLLSRAALTLTLAWVSTLAMICVAEPTVELDGPMLVLHSGALNGAGGDAPVTYNRVDREYFIVWAEYYGVGQQAVCAQRVSDRGVLIGQNLTLIQAGDSLSGPSVAHDWISNRYLVTWRYQGGVPGTGDFNHAYGFLATASGQPVITPQDLGIGGFGRSIVFNPMAGDDGEFFFSGRSYATDGPPGIFGQRVTTTGTPNGITPLSTVGGPIGQVALNPDRSQYLVTWRGSDGCGVKGRIVEDDGSLMGDGIDVSQACPQSSLAAGAAFDARNERYLVVFDDGLSGHGPIRGRIVTADGSLLGPPFVLAENNVLSNPQSTFDRINQVFFVTWMSTNRHIWGQLVTSDGDLIGEPLDISNRPNTHQPRVIANDRLGGFLVTWANPVSRSMHAQLIAVRGGALIFADSFETGDASAWSESRLAD